VVSRVTTLGSTVRPKSLIKLSFFVIETRAFAHGERICYSFRASSRSDHILCVLSEEMIVYTRLCCIDAEGFRGRLVKR